MSCNASGRSSAPPCVLFLRSIIFGLAVVSGIASAQTFTIDRAEWSSSDGGRLRVEGSGIDNRTVTIKNAGNGVVLGTTTVDGDEWDRRFRGLTQVPCRVRAEQSGGGVAERDVQNRPANCGPVAGRPTLTIGNVSQAEGNSGTSTMRFTVSLSAPAPTGGVSFTVNTANGTTNPATAGSDYVAITNSTRSIAAGATSANVDVTINGDTTVEPNETFTVNLSGISNTTNATASATGTIVNDDQVAGLPTLSIANAAVTEGNAGTTATMTFNVTLSAPAPTGGVNFTVNTVNGTGATGATAPSDFTAITNSARSIAAGATSTTIQVTVNGDTTVEQTETFTVNLTGITNTTNATASATGNITNDDQAQGVGILPAPNVGAATYTVLGSNDLGMHCADQDYQVFSILPPFNVLHAQVIRKGTSQTALPSIVNGTAADVFYAASTNPNDPAGAGSINTGSAGAGFKSNFWDQIAGTSPLQTQGTQSYRGLYPVLGGASSALDLFSPLLKDVGLPVPDPNDLPTIVPFQQNMPSAGSATPVNVPQQFKHFYTDLAFFNLPLAGISGAPRIGFVVTGLNAFAAEGVPILPVDDAGRSNPYPLLRIGATLKATANGPAVPPSATGSNVVGSLDIVVPVASEADCQSCHGAIGDTGLTQLGYVSNGEATDLVTGASAFTVARSTDAATPGSTTREKVLNAAKINILRLHDKKHGAAYRSWSGTTLASTPCTSTSTTSCLDTRRHIQCSQCHYTPALDLAQVGPIDEPAQGANGRQQRSHISMSRAMHGHHGELVSKLDGATLFPAMAAPGPTRTATTVNATLEQTCYHCHPGKNTKCMRGAMTTASTSNPGGQACQDCHGNMTQVGNDFSESFPVTPGVLATGKRVPWRNEPMCQSCHIGDAVSSPNVITTGVIRRSQIQTQNGTANVQVDNIRLLRAYTNTEATDPILNNIVSAGSRFAENQALYRLSTGHGGVQCRSCHGATHSEWPNQVPQANDNVAANQLQGHAGTVSDCRVCHAPGSATEVSSMDTYTGLGGPHGMHVVGPNSPFQNRNLHGVLGNNFANCQPCHGGTSRSNSQGTVLSRASRTKTIDGNTVQQGTPIGCQLCH